MKINTLAAVTLMAAVSSMSLPVHAENKLAISKVEKSVLPLERWIDGKIQAVHQSTVSAETSGRVQEILYDVGDTVPAGAVIIKLVSNEQQQSYNQALAMQAEARANADVLTKEFNRLSEIYQQQLIAKSDYDKAAGNLASAKARLQSAEAAVKSASERLSYTVVKAPFGGVVYARYVELGEAVQPGKPLMSGFDPSLLRVEADMPQSIAEPVARYKKARVLIPQHADIVPEKLSLFPQAENISGTVRLRLDLPVTEVHFMPGGFAKVALVVGEQARLLIPRTSVIRRSEIEGVYIQKNGRWALRQVRLGEDFADKVEVLAGVSEGEVVAENGIAAAIEAGKGNH